MIIQIIFLDMPIILSRIENGKRIRITAFPFLPPRGTQELSAEFILTMYIQESAVPYRESRELILQDSRKNYSPAMVFPLFQNQSIVPIISRQDFPGRPGGCVKSFLPLRIIDSGIDTVDILNLLSDLQGIVKVSAIHRQGIMIFLPMTYFNPLGKFENNKVSRDPDSFYQKVSSLYIYTGAFVSLLESGIEQKIEIFGKPSSRYFQNALQSLDIPAQDIARLV